MFTIDYYRDTVVAAHQASSVIVVGALLAVGVTAIAAGSYFAKFFGFLALIMASVNIFGGFLVTNRMLAMYKRKEPKK